MPKKHGKRREGGGSGCARATTTPGVVFVLLLFIRRQVFPNKDKGKATSTNTLCMVSSNGLDSLSYWETTTLTRSTAPPNLNSSALVYAPSKLLVALSLED